MDLMQYSVEHLRSRVVLGSMLIRMLQAEQDDPRAPAAIERLRARQREINAAVVAKMALEREARGEAQPEAVQVGLRPVRLRGEAPGGQEFRTRLLEAIERLKATLEARTADDGQ